MTGLTEERKAGIWDKLRAMGDEPLTPKDVEALTMMLTCEPGLKGLGRLAVFADESARGFVALDLGTPQGVAEGLKLQGRIQGYLHSLEVLYGLITLPEEDENVDSD